MIDIIINNIKELLLRIGSDHVLSVVGLAVTLLSFIHTNSSLFFTKEKYYNKRKLIVQNIY